MTVPRILVPSIAIALVFIGGVGVGRSIGGGGHSLTPEQQVGRFMGGQLTSVIGQSMAEASLAESDEESARILVSGLRVKLADWIEEIGVRLDGSGDKGRANLADWAVGMEAVK